MFKVSNKLHTMVIPVKKPCDNMILQSLLNTLKLNSISGTIFLMNPQNFIVLEFGRLITYLATGLQLCTQCQTPLFLLKKCKKSGV